MSLDVLYSKMQARWPLTWKLVGVRPGRTYKYSIYALGDFLPLSESEVAHGCVGFDVMDWFETHFEQICHNVTDNTWVSYDTRERYPHITNRIEIPQTYVLCTIRFDNYDTSHVIIGGKMIFLDGHMGGATDGIERLENFLAEVEKNRVDCHTEITARLPQPIAEEILEQI